MQIEFFDTLPLQNVIPSYLYFQYQEDDALQAFVNSQNSLAQGYLDWFNTTPLAVYTLPTISGQLLDWIGQGIYGIPRPVLSDATVTVTTGYNEDPYNTVPYDGDTIVASGSSYIASDDIYKRVLTWNLYRGDGRVFNMLWLKKRIARFIYGVNGSDYPVLDVLPSITVSGNTFTIYVDNSSISLALQSLIDNNNIQIPFQYIYDFVLVYFINNGGLLQITEPNSYPSSPSGLPTGSVWNDGGVVAIAGSPSPPPSPTPIFFADITPSSLLAMGANDLPLTNPSNPGQLWNNGGTIAISS